MYTDNDFRNYELYHHGILGMKWGKKNGPPYPLAAGDHSASEKRAGWRNSLGSSGSISRQIKTSRVSNSTTKKSESKSQEQEKKGLTDKQKKALIIGATVLGTAVAAYGGYKVYKAVKTMDSQALIKARDVVASAYNTGANRQIRDAKKGLKTGYFRAKEDFEWSPEKRLDSFHRIYRQDTINAKTLAKQVVNEVGYDIEDLRTRLKGGDTSNNFRALRDQSIANELARSEKDFNKAVTKYNAASKAYDSAKNIYKTSHPDEFTRRLENISDRSWGKSRTRHRHKIAKIGK